MFSLENIVLKSYPIQVTSLSEADRLGYPIYFSCRIDEFQMETGALSEMVFKTRRDDTVESS